MAMINYFSQACSDDDSDDDDDSSLSSGEFSLGGLCVMSLSLAEREFKFVHTRTNWDHHASILIHEKQFHVKYRMPYASFEKLCRLRGPLLLM